MKHHAGLSIGLVRQGVAKASSRFIQGPQDGPEEDRKRLGSNGLLSPLSRVEVELAKVKR